MFQEVDIFQCIDAHQDYFNKLCIQDHQFFMVNPQEQYKYYQEIQKHNLQGYGKYQKQGKTSIQDEEEQIQHEDQKEFNLHENGNYGIKRQQNKIDFSIISKAQRSNSNFYDTKNMGKHLKSILKKYYHLLIQSKYFDRDQERAIFKFVKTSGGLKSYKQLFTSEHIRLRSYDFLKSKFYIEFVMTDNKLNIKSRLMMIKYAEKIRKLASQGIETWTL